ncbi:histidine kinase [Burkholderia cenocepacia]|uniref:histidine kinase n=1 Tax=Burkholderia cenocepacia TaxID=95486 RepID=UPI0021AB0DCB|nr:histidine kinase [Burkholderia cenocepacia]
MLPARPGRQIGQAIGLAAIVVVLLVGTVAFVVHALHAPAALSHDATADAMRRSASTYLVLATALFVCLLAAAFDLFRLLRHMLATLAMADTAGRIVAGDPSARTVSRDGCPADLARFIDHFNAMTHSMKSTNPSDATATVASSSRVTLTHLAELETRLDAIKALATDDADASSRDALLQHVDALFRCVEDLQVTERQVPAIRTFPR